MEADGGAGVRLGGKGWVEGVIFFFQAEDGIRDLVRSRGLGDVYKRQMLEKMGFEVEAVDDGEVAVEKAREGLYDIILLDLSLIHI